MVLPRKIILHLILISVFDAGIFFAWVITSIFPVPPFNFVHYGLYEVLRFIFPAEFVNSGNFQGNIYPFFIVPVIFIFNLIYFRAIQLTALKGNRVFLANSLFSGIPFIVIGLVVFVLPAAVESIFVNKEIEGFKVVAPPTYVLQKTSPDRSNLIIILPSTFKEEFKGYWVPAYFNIRFSPNNEVVVKEVSNCELTSSGFNTRNLQSFPKEKMPAGRYDLEFSFEFSGQGCTSESLSILVGKNIEVLKIWQNQANPQILYSYPITSFILKESIYK